MLQHNEFGLQSRPRSVEVLTAAGQFVNLRQQSARNGVARHKPASGGRESPEHEIAALRSQEDAIVRVRHATGAGFGRAFETGGTDTSHARGTLVPRSPCMAQSHQPAGQSAIFNPHGECLARLTEDVEGLLLFDTETNEAATVT